MDKCYNIDGFILKVSFNKQTVCLVANYALRASLQKSPVIIEKLCKLILEDWQKIYGKPLRVELNSFVMEILGHVYAYQILIFLRKIISLKIFRKYSLRACNIDCGDKKTDSNRWFWDLCGYFKPVIFLLRK